MHRGLELTSLAEARHFWYSGFRRFVTPAIEAVTAGRPGLRLIDCGCGTGANMRLLAPYGRVWGFDLTEWGAQHARATAGRPVVRADITRIPFASATFDVATSFDVLQMVEADGQALREMARIVRPGGAVVLTLAALDFLRGDHAISWNEVRRYTPARARRLLGLAGLRAERVRFLFASVFPVIAAARLTQRVLRPFRGVRDDLDMSVPAAPINAALTALVTAEAALARRIRMPIGSSLLVVARKP
jgi:ubiquinone/menaquinone biosynthesis C-methylase UbiE